MGAISIDTYTFFLIGLSGFMAVYTFRYFSNSKKKMVDFEFIGLSAFWGLIILLIWELMTQPEKVKQLVANPFAAGLALSLFGIILGWSASHIVNKGWFRKLKEWISPSD